jgi:hypothetical protein
MFTNLQVSTFKQLNASLGADPAAHSFATKLFERAFESGLRGQFFAKLFNNPNQLRSLSRQPEKNMHHPYVTIVPVQKIIGTEGRSEDFDKNFRPLKRHIRERWISIAAARWSGVPLPAVELVQDGDQYYVRDGHHRISVARMMGQVEIDAKIV